jgi:hypothetical protein
VKLSNTNTEKWKRNEGDERMIREGEVQSPLVNLESETGYVETELSETSCFFEMIRSPDVTEYFHANWKTSITIVFPAFVPEED